VTEIRGAPFLAWLFAHRALQRLNFCSPATFINTTASRGIFSVISGCSKAPFTLRDRFARDLGYILLKFKYQIQVLLNHLLFRCRHGHSFLKNHYRYTDQFCLMSRSALMSASLVFVGARKSVLRANRVHICYTSTFREFPKCRNVTRNPASKSHLSAFTARSASRRNLGPESG